MPSETVWEMQEQTVAKHLVLQAYLNGWLPILGRWNDRLLFVDGFAGPGQYEAGEPGSPLIALDCIRRHKEQGERILRDVEVVLLFIEDKVARAKHLESLLKQERLPSHTSYNVWQGTFQDHMNDLLDYIDKQSAELAPAFVMIDPFGVKGSPMKLIERILRNDKCECMISFMYEPIRRFRQHPGFKLNLDELYGTEEWQRSDEMNDEEARKLYLHDLYKTQLKAHGAEHVVSFELWNRSKYVYTIYFASGSLKGCDLMKQSIWKVDPTGGYKPRWYTGRQQMLFDTSTEPLVEQLRDRFGHRPTPIEDIEAFVMSDETIYHKGHLRRKTLGPLEKEGRISVSRPLGARGFTNGKGIKVRFR